MIRAILCAALAAALAGSSVAAAPDPGVDALKQRIWTAFSDVDAAQGKLPPARRATGPALQQLYRSKRDPVVAELWAIGAADPRSPRGLQALGLVTAWGEPGVAAQALALLLRDHADDDALAAQLEAAYGDSAAPDKRSVLVRLAAHSRSKAVAGSSLYLLAQEALSRPASSRATERREEAFSQLRRVEDRYGAQPTTLLGGGESGRLGAAAAALLFREQRLAVGATLPPMAAHDLDAHAVTSADFGRRYTLVDFWATWCPPCVAAFPTLAQLRGDYGPRLNIVSVSADASPATARAFVQKEGATWTQWWVGPSGRVSSAWSNSSYPYFILVGPSGRILAKGADIARMKQAIEREVH